MTNYRQTMSQALEYMHFIKEVQILERELTDTEIKRREEIAQDLDDQEFKDRYGKDWMQVKMGTATKMAKAEAVHNGKDDEEDEEGDEEERLIRPGGLREKADVSLKKKAEKSGISASILKQVYNRGVAAWRTGHRPGTTPEQWGHARVNSFISKSSGTWGGSDKDLAAKARGQKEEFDLEEGKMKDLVIKGQDLEMYAKKSGGIDKNDMMKVAAMLKKGNKSGAVKYAMKLDTDPKEYILNLIGEETDLDEGKMQDVWQKKNARSLSVGPFELIRGKGGVSTIKRSGKVIGDFSYDDEADNFVANIKGERAQWVGDDIDSLFTHLQKNHKEEVDLDEKVKEYKGVAYFKDLKDAEAHMKKFAPKGRVREYDRGYAVQTKIAGPYLNKSGKVEEEFELDERMKLPRQLIDTNKEVMLVKKNKVIVVDKKDQDKYMKQGWILAEEVELDEVFNGTKKDIRKIARATDNALRKRSAQIQKMLKSKTNEKGRGLTDFEFDHISDEGDAIAAELVYRKKGGKGPISDDIPPHLKKFVNEEVELDEAKYEIYHKDFSSAMQHAYKMAKKLHGITIDPKEIDDKVASGPRKPSSGKTNSYRLKGDKGAIQVQVYNMDNKKYELNMYKEEVELDESEFSAMAYGKKDQRFVVKPRDTKGMKGKQDKFKMYVVKLDNKGNEREIIKDLGTHVSIDRAIGFAKNKGIIEKVELDEVGGSAFGGTIDKIQKVVDDKQATKIDGVMVDTFTASLIMNIFNKVNKQNQDKMRKMKVTQLAKAAYKLAGVKEELDDKDKPTVKKIIGKLKKASQAHAGQADTLQKAVDESAASDARRAMRRDPDMRQRGFSKDMSATDDDVKGASKNIMMQMRKAQSLRGRFDVEFADGKKVRIPEKIAIAVQQKYNAMRKPSDKEKFQAQVAKSYKSMLSALKEGFASDAQRRAAFASGYKEKGKKNKKESILDRIDNKLKERKNG